MSNRNSNRVIRTNGAEIYKELLESRGLKKAKQYTTAIFNKLTSQNIRNVQTIRHIWTTGDRLYKLAAEHYGDSEMWWLIAWYNQKPTDSHIRLGDTVLIPLPLSEMMGLFYSSKAR
jgi:hypothetical protein|tara:strand:+ start:197 stop:547 length:351 start_codon:yes stop_codon:yes gene_type:complete